MNKTTLIATAILFMMVTTSTAIAQSEDSASSAQEIAYEYCEALANDHHDENSWNAMFNNCMQEQGFGEHEEDTSDITADDDTSDDVDTDEDDSSDQ